MNLHEIRKVAAKIKDATEKNETLHEPLYGGCVWTSRKMAAVVQAIIHENLPHLASLPLTICMGNYRSDGDPAFDEQLCRRAVVALREIDIRPVNAPYHTWLEFDDTIIDLTFLYTTLPESKLPKELLDEMEAQPIYYNAENGFLPYGLTLEYVPLARFAPSGHRLIDEQIDVPAALNDAGEKGIDLLRSIKEPRWHWSKDILGRMFRRKST